MNQLVDHSGSTCALGAKIGEGAEGAVFELQADRSRVAKVYHHPVPTSKAAKLALMVSQAQPDLLKFTAWPTGLLLNAASRQLMGFLMHSVSGYQPLYHLYNPAMRRRYFPKSEWRFLVRAARNCAIAFDNVHRRGHVVGDVNQNNVFVAADAQIKLVDCDSYQIVDGTHRYLCDVGVPHFTPPELQSLSSYAGTVRTSNHDAFGLAVLIFHLLMLGKHPFAGTYLRAGDMPIEKAISEYRFAFGMTAVRRDMKPPPNTPSLDLVGHQIDAMFSRAFGPEGVTTGRPTAKEWELALATLESTVGQCPVTRVHQFPRHLSRCPWCTFDSYGCCYFLDTAVAAQFTFDIEELLRAIFGAKPPVDLSALVSRPVSGATKGRSVPTEARVEQAGGLLPLPSTPQLLLIEVPELLGEFQADPIPKPPSPPILEPVPSPPSEPPFFDVAKHQQALSSLLGDRACSRAKTSFLWASTGACLSLLWPLIAVALAIVAIGSGIAWMSLYGRRRRILASAWYQTELRKRHEREAWLIAYEQANVARLEVVARNAAAQHAWESARQQYEEQRRTYPVQMEIRRREWDAESERIRLQRHYAIQENATRKRRWEQENKGLEERERKVREHNDRVLRTQQAYAAERQRRVNARSAVATKIERARDQFRRDSVHSSENHKRMLAEAQSLQADYQALRQQYERELKELTANQRQTQLRQYLQDLLIEDAEIPHVGTARKNTLAAYGFDTAWDIHTKAIHNVPGFGEFLVGELAKWLRNAQAEFRFDPQRSLPPQELAALQSRFRPRKQQIEQRLRAIREQLHTNHKDMRGAAEELNKELCKWYAELMQCEADLTVMPQRSHGSFD